MQENWYIVYTKPKCEKKIAVLLTKRKIENFCPLNCKELKNSRKSKLHYEPLFDSYVFVRVEESKLFSLRQVENVLNLVYWKGSPATVKDEEIEAIREFTSYHQNIKLERINVNENWEPRNIDVPYYSIDGKILMIKNRAFCVGLPSLGFKMIAEVESEDVIGREIPFGNKEFSMH